MSDILAHYASKYYDPVKAREYYLRTRELKGRQPGSPLPEEAKKSPSPPAKVTETPIKKVLGSQVKTHNQKAKDSAYKLMLAYEKLSPGDKKFYGPRIKQKIDDIRKENDTLRKKLTDARNESMKRAAARKRSALKAERERKAASRRRDKRINTKASAKSDRGGQIFLDRVPQEGTVRKTVQAKPRATTRKI